MEVTVENLEQAVALFYRSEAGQEQQRNAHKWLADAQNSPQAWAFVWDLLHPGKNTEVQFFAATTLHTKLIKHWNEVPVEQYNELKNKLINGVMTFAMGPTIVLNRLCISLSSFIVRVLSTFWPSAIHDVVDLFQPNNQGQLQPDRAAWMLLEVLTNVPEEFRTSIVPGVTRNKLRLDISSKSNFVLSILQRYLMSSSPSGQPNDHKVTLQKSACCATAWFRLCGVPLDQCVELVRILLKHVYDCYWMRQYGPHGDMTGDEHDLSEAALEAVQVLMTEPESLKHPDLVIQFLEFAIGVLEPIPVFEASINNTNEDIIVNIHTFYISVAETHSRLIINSLSGSNAAHQRVILHLIDEIMKCSDRMGSYPVDESSSQLAFGFWYMIQDDVLSLSGDTRTQCIELVRPVYHRLVKVLIRKSILPIDADHDLWSSEDKEVFRCYRQDVSDTLMYCYAILMEDLLETVMDLMMSAYPPTSSNWTIFEACVTAFSAVACQVNCAEQTFIPRLLSLLKTIPYTQLDEKLLVSALDTIGSYGEWFYANPQYLADVIPLICEALQFPSSGSAQATLALKDMTRDCQDHLGPYKENILEACQTALQSAHIKDSELVRIMYSVGKVLPLLESNKAIECLNNLISPSFNELQQLGDAEVINSYMQERININLRMIAMLFSSLDINTPSDGSSHPVLALTTMIMPILVKVAEKSHWDTSIMVAICAVLKNAVCTLGDKIEPMLNDLCFFVLVAFRVEPKLAAFEVVQNIVIIFHRDQTKTPMLIAFLNEIVSHCMKACQSNWNKDGGSEMSDLIETLYYFLACLEKKCIQLLKLTTIHWVEVFTLATACLSMPEVHAMRGCSAFLVHFMNQGTEVPTFEAIIQEHGTSLIKKILMCIGSEVPRTQLDYLAEIILAFLKKFPHFLSIGINECFAIENFPTSKPTPEQKKHFFNLIFKERANKSKIAEIVRHFAVVCRGLDSDYGNQFNPFF